MRDKEKLYSINRQRPEKKTVAIYALRHLSLI